MLVHPKLVQRFHRIVALDLDPEICLERKIERAGSYRSPEKTTRLFQDFERPMVADQWERILHLERTFHLRQKKHGELIF